MEAVLQILIPLLKKFEGCRLTAYQDQVGIWTIGWGETLHIQQGMVWTQQLADEVLTKRAAQFLLATYTKCPQLYLEPPARVAACTSLAYNIGVGAFSRSSVCRKTARRDYQGAADSFLLWNKAGGKVNRILALRRAKERALYLSNGFKQF